MQMTAFDDLIGRVCGYTAECGEARASHIGASERITSIPKVCGGVVLRSQMHCELGGPSEHSCGYCLPTASSKGFEDGRVRVLGMGCGEMPKGACVPFAQVLLLAGEGLDDSNFQKLVDSQHARSLVPGYMMRSYPGKMWGRVSVQAVQAGFDFETLGAALREHVTKVVPEVELFEAIFATRAADVKFLEGLSSEYLGITHDLKKKLWGVKGIDIDCPFGGHCGACSRKDTCDEIRHLSALRKVEGE